MARMDEEKAVRAAESDSCPLGAMKLLDSVIKVPSSLISSVPREKGLERIDNSTYCTPIYLVDS